MADWKTKLVYGLAGALVLGVLLWFTGYAHAADLGKGGSADLEERIAELEATTARKGNRKVSLTVSGWVGEQIMHWDDGESDTYIGGLGRTIASNVKFTGEAKINPTLSAGFVLHLEAIDNDALKWDQSGTGPGGFDTLQSFWFIKSETLGKVSLGRQSTVSDNAAIVVDQSGSLIPANWVMFDGAGMALKSGGVRLDQTLGSWPLTVTSDRALSWGNQVGHCSHSGLGTGGDCTGVPLDSVRYDSPVFSGFSASASWASDNNVYDVALRYTGEFAGFKVAATVAYSDAQDIDSKYTQAAGYVQHVATGLFFYGAYGQEDNSGTESISGNIVIGPFGPPAGPACNPCIGPFKIPFSASGIDMVDSNQWYLKAGVRQKFSSLGNTVVYGFYSRNTDQLGPELRVLGATESEVNTYGAGLVQELDGAAMSLWVKYLHREGSASDGTPGGKVDFDDVDMIGAGALVNF